MVNRVSDPSLSFIYGQSGAAPALSSPVFAVASAPIVALAHSDVTQFRVVRVRPDGTVQHADTTASAQIWQVVGIATGSAPTGTPVSIMTAGVLESPDWDWAEELPIYFDDAGTLTQTIPTTGFARVVAFPLGAKKIAVAVVAPTPIPLFLDDPGVSALKMVGSTDSSALVDLEQGAGKQAPAAGFLRLSNNAGKIEARRDDATFFLIGETSPIYAPIPSAPNSGLVGGQNFGENDDLSDWVEFDGGGKITASVENGCLVILKEGDAGTQFRGFGRDLLPSGDFTIVCEMSFQRHNSGGGGQRAYFALFEDITDTSKKSLGIGYYVDLNSAQAATVSCDAFDDSTTSANAFTTQNVTLGGGVFTQLLRIKRVGTDYTFHCSSTGREWQVVKSAAIGIGFTPTGFGFWMAAAADVTCIIPWIHIYDDTAPSQVFGGTLPVRVGA